MCIRDSSRTYHRLASAVEDAGFEIRDQIMYLYGSGFPKSLNVSKAAKDKVCQCSVEWSYGTAEPQTEREVRPLREHDVPQTINVKGKSGEVLLTSLQEQGSSTSRRQELSSTEVWSGESSVEGWSDPQKSEGQLQGSPLREVSEGVSGNGSQGWLHNGTSSSDGSMDGSLTGSKRSSESHQSQSLGQSQGEPRTVSDQRRPQEGGSWQVCGRCGKPMVNGWGTALKPAHEPIVVARKPLIGTVATNVLTYGTGALNIDGSRVGTDDTRSPASKTALGVMNDDGWVAKEVMAGSESGRWPANVIHDGSEEVLEGFPNSKSGKPGVRLSDGFNSGVYGTGMGIKSGQDNGEYGDSGSAARFFYCAKASKSERNAGLEGLPEYATGVYAQDEWSRNNMTSIPTMSRNFHPTVKPLALMRYLVKLVTPPNGTVLDPFLGSGSTAVACVLEGFDWIGCEMTEDYWPIIEARVEWAEAQPRTLL